jgi:hypothetical protein
VPFTLTRDITAGDLAMDSPDPGEGYPSDHIIGPKGSTVTVIGNEDNGWVEVTGFANDRYAQGYLPLSDLQEGER